MRMIDKQLLHHKISGLWGSARWPALSCSSAMSLFVARLAVVGLSLFGVFGEAWAKPVDFDLSFSHSGTTPPKRPLSHIFVLDRSGSMATPDAEMEDVDGKVKTVSRWEALRESLRVTLENTPGGSAKGRTVKA